MTVREYITKKLQAFNPNDADLSVMAAETGLELNEDYTADNAQNVGVGLVGIIESLVFAPRVNNVSESGFSVSWNFDNMGKYYLYLCNKYGVTPNDDVTSMLGVSMIKDVSYLW